MIVVSGYYYDNESGERIDEDEFYSMKEFVDDVELNWEYKEVVKEYKNGKWCVL